MNEIAQSNQLITRLTENGRRNAATFRAAGINGPGRQTRCLRCGLFEGLLFWTLVESKAGCLDLRCPAGCGTQVSFRAVAAGDMRAAGGPRPDVPAGDPAGAEMGKWLILPLVFFAAAALALSNGSRTEMIAERLRSLTETSSTSDREWGSDVSASRISLAGLARQGSSSVESISLPFYSLRHSPTVRVLSGEGDRREEVAVLIETVAEVYGDDARAAVESVYYNPEADATSVVVYPDLPAWKAYISSSLPKVLAASSAEVR